MKIGAVGLVPDLLGEHVAGGGVAFVGLDQGADVVAGGQFVMGALAGEERPDAALAVGVERAAIGALAIAIPVVAEPAGTLGQVALEDGIDDFEGINHERVVGAADAVADQFEEAGVDNFAGFELIALAGRTVVDVNFLGPGAFAEDGFAILRRADAHVVALDAFEEYAIVGHGPVFE